MCVTYVTVIIKKFLTRQDAVIDGRYLWKRVRGFLFGVLDWKGFMRYLGSRIPAFGERRSFAPRAVDEVGSLAMSRGVTVADYVSLQAQIERQGAANREAEREAERLAALSRAQEACDFATNPVYTAERVAYLTNTAILHPFQSAGVQAHR